MTPVIRLLCAFDACCVFGFYLLPCPRWTVAAVGALGWLVAASFAGRT